MIRFIDIGSAESNRTCALLKTLLRKRKQIIVST